jgi:CRP/FNR family transcriptional regulator, cyclic AMP receptor protein
LPLSPNRAGGGDATVTHRSNKIEALETIGLFAGLSRRELERVSRLTHDIEVPAGHRVATVGETGRELFIIVEGRALVSTPRGRSLHLGPGDCFGEMSLIDGEPRSANVQAVTPMRLLAVGYREFWQLLDEHLSIVRKITRTLARRLREAERSV